jgi:hypothetical protein
MLDALGGGLPARAHACIGFAAPAHTPSFILTPPSIPPSLPQPPQHHSHHNIGELPATNAHSRECDAGGTRIACLRAIPHPPPYPCPPPLQRHADRQVHKRQQSQSMQMCASSSRGTGVHTNGGGQGQGGESAPEGQTQGQPLHTRASNRGQCTLQGDPTAISATTHCVEVPDTQGTCVRAQCARDKWPRRGGGYRPWAQANTLGPAPLPHHTTPTAPPWSDSRWVRVRHLKQQMHPANPPPQKTE